jgi:hypothetical protein
MNLQSRDSRLHCAIKVALIHLHNFVHLCQIDADPAFCRCNMTLHNMARKSLIGSIYLGVGIYTYTNIQVLICKHMDMHVS